VSGLDLDSLARYLPDDDLLGQALRRAGYGMFEVRRTEERPAAPSTQEVLTPSQLRDRYRLTSERFFPGRPINDEHVEKYVRLHSGGGATTRRSHPTLAELRLRFPPKSSVHLQDDEIG